MPNTNADAELIKLGEKFDAAQSEHDRLSDIEDRAHEKHDAENPMPDALKVRPDDEGLGIPGRDPQQRAVDEIIDTYYGRDRSTKGQTEGPESYRPYDDNMLIETLRKPKWPVPEKIDLPPDMRPYIVAGIVGMRDVEPSPAARARADEIIAAYDEWKIRDNAGSREIYANEGCAQVEAFEDLSDIAQEIMATPAHTTAGLRIKARAAWWVIKDQGAGYRAGSFDDCDLLFSIVQDLLREAPAA